MLTRELGQESLASVPQMSRRSPRRIGLWLGSVSNVLYLLYEWWALLDSNQ